MTLLPTMFASPPGNGNDIRPGRPLAGGRVATAKRFAYSVLIARHRPGKICIDFWQEPAPAKRRGRLVILDALGSVVCANRRAHEIFASREAVVTDVGRLRMAGDDQKEELDDAITRAISVSGAGPPAHGMTMLLIRRHGRKPLFVLALPLRARSERIAQLIPAAVLIISDPERDETSEAVLGQLYGLTRAEVVMLRAVLTGDGLQRAAARLKVSPNTAKTHVARILAKTAAGGQGELIRLICPEVGLVRWD